MVETNRPILLVMLLICGINVHSQIPEEEIPTYQQKVTDMVNFLEYCLNTVGDNATSPRDKDVIINQSYGKIFRDEEVQVEDDLEEREAIINKNVKAYLKDVDFFFIDAEFDFEIIESQPLTDENGQPFFKVEVNRTLTATSIEGEQINNKKIRFIEINLNLEKDDLKIASIYTTKVSKEQQVAEWWQDLSFGWMNLIQEAIGVVGNPTPDDLLLMVRTDSLNLSGDPLITDLSPLYIFSDLRYLNISNTATYDLMPLRSLSHLTHLDASNTEIVDLDYLKYHSQLHSLNLANTQVRNLDGLEKLIQLKELNLSGTYVTEFGPVFLLTDLLSLNLSNTNFSFSGALTPLKKLRKLDVSGTEIQDLNQIGGLQQLQELIIQRTEVNTLDPLATLSELRVLDLDRTYVKSLEALANLKKLERVYCNNTGIEEKAAREFMNRHPGTLVMHNSEALTKWWERLPGPWKEQLMGYLDRDVPPMEGLVKLISVDSLNLSGTKIQSAEPLRQFVRLRYLNLDQTQITDIQPLSGMEELVYASFNQTQVQDLTPLKDLRALKEIYLNAAPIRDIFPLTAVKSLHVLSADNCGLRNAQVKEFINVNPNCLVLFQTDTYLQWWKELPEEWKDVFSGNVDLPAEPGSADIHRLLQSPAIKITRAELLNLKPLAEFLLLRKLEIEESPITEMSYLGELSDLESLTVTKSPLYDLAPVGRLRYLKKLDISNTAVEDLRVISDLKNLEVLNFSGTNVKRLRGVEGLTSLEKIDCSNTRVFRLEELFTLPNLDLLTCYNSRLNESDIRYFKEVNQTCKIVFY